MSPHRENHRDVSEWFAKYLVLTGDTEAKLLRDGAYWSIEGRYPGLQGYGAGSMVLALRCFCVGWEANAPTAPTAPRPSSFPVEVFVRMVVPLGAFGEIKMALQEHLGQYDPQLFTHGKQLVDVADDG